MLVERWGMVMLVKMVRKNMDRKNMLLYALGIVLSIVLDTFFVAALMVNQQYGLNEKSGSMDWPCTLFFLIAGVVSVFFTLYSAVVKAGFWLFLVEYLVILIYFSKKGFVGNAAERCEKRREA